MPSVLTVILGLLAFIVVCFNASATLRIWRDEFLERNQRIAQTFLVWLLPLIGALAVLWSLREEKFERRRYEGPSGDDGRFL